MSIDTWKYLKFVANLFTVNLHFIFLIFGIYKTVFVVYNIIEFLLRYNLMFAIKFEKFYIVNFAVHKRCSQWFTPFVRAVKYIWRSIEVVITDMTRNHDAPRGTWVRIPPSPPRQGFSFEKPCFFYNDFFAIYNAIPICFFISVILH